MDPFYRSRSYLTPQAIFYLYKSQIRPKMEYCSHIWAGSPMCVLSVLVRLQNRMKYLVGDELFYSLQPLGHRRNMVSLPCSIVTSMGNAPQNYMNSSLLAGSSLVVLGFPSHQTPTCCVFPWLGENSTGAVSSSEHPNCGMLCLPIVWMIRFSAIQTEREQILSPVDYTWLKI